MMGPFNTVMLVAVLSVAPAPAAPQDAPAATARSQDKGAGPRPRHALYKVGDKVPEGSKMVPSFPGLDLPTLSDAEGYLRSNEHIYRVDRKTLKVLDVVSLATVLLM